MGKHIFFLTVCFLKHFSPPPRPLSQTPRPRSYPIICHTMTATEGEVKGKIMERREKEEVVGNSNVDYICIYVLFLSNTKQAEVLTLCQTERD